MAIIMVRTNGCMIEREVEVEVLDGVQVIIKHATISHVRGCDCDDGGHSYKGGQEEAGQGDNKVKENETPKFKRWISGTGPPSRNTSEMELLVF